MGISSIFIDILKRRDKLIRHPVEKSIKFLKSNKGFNTYWTGIGKIYSLQCLFCKGPKFNQV